ncbi:MAG: AmmeMemoRadiSam system radical SAM enzyme, partial [Coxiella sp. (in: Bacteria)]
EIARAAEKLNCRSIAFTYNDPVVFLEYAIDIAVCCHERNIKSVAVSAGYICDAPRREFFSYMDATNIDLKAFSQHFYKTLTGSDLNTVLDTLVYLKHETDVWFEITTLLIPGQNDSPQEIEKMAQWIMTNLGPDIPLFFTAFHPDWKMKDIPPTPLATLTQARTIAMQQGLHYVYTGNRHNPVTESTYCANCQQVLIERDWHRILSFEFVDNNHCPNCNTPCPGVFEEQPGQWGQRRVAVRLGQIEKD